MQCQPTFCRFHSCWFFIPELWSSCRSHPPRASQQGCGEAHQKGVTLLHLQEPLRLEMTPESLDMLQKVKYLLWHSGGRRTCALMYFWWEATCEKTGDRAACRIHIPKCHLAIQPARAETWADGEIIFSLKILYLSNISCQVPSKEGPKQGKRGAEVGCVAVDTSLWFLRPLHFESV